MTGFFEELDAQKRRSVVLENGESVPLCRARFRQPGENPDLTAQEGVFGFGKVAIGLYGTRARMSARGVLEIADGWGDSVRFGTSSASAFEDAIWETDQWDLPAPVPPLTISPAAIAAFKPQASAISAAVISTERLDHDAASAAIAAHWTACHYRSCAPEVRWFTGLDTALEALSNSRAHSGGLKKTLRDRALMHFDFEITARLHGQGSELKDAIWRMTTESLGYDIHSAILERIVSSRVQSAFDYMGLISDYPRFSWYRFLRSIGVELPEVVSTFCAMTATAWVFFPTRDVIFAVEAPTAVEEVGASCALVFGGGDRLVLAESAKLRS